MTIIGRPATPLEVDDVARRLAELAGLAGGPAAPPERTLPRVIKSRTVVRGDVAPEPMPLLPPEPVYPEGYIPLEEAHRLGQEALASAHAAADGIREEARANGQQEGFAAGMAAGQQAALDAWSGLLKSFKEQIEATLGLRQKILAEAEPDVIRLVLLAVSKVIQQESRRQDLVCDLVRRTLPRASGHSVVTIRVSPGDFARLEAAPLASPGLARYDLVADPAIGVGGCRIETPLSTVDATFRLAFEEVARELMQEEPASDPMVAVEIDALAETEP